MSVEAFARILSCCAIVIAATATPLPAMAEGEDQAGAANPSLCIDEMATQPDYDDLEATPVSATVDGGCLLSLQPIST